MKIRVGSLVKFLEDGDIGVVTKILSCNYRTSDFSFCGSVFFSRDKKHYHNFSADISLPQHVSSITDCVLLRS